MDRDVFVLRLCVAGSRASGAEQTRHGQRDAFVFFVAVLDILSTTDKRVTWSVTRLFRVCVSLAPARPAPRKRVTVRVTRLFALSLSLIFCQRRTNASHGP